MSCEQAWNTLSVSTSAMSSAKGERSSMVKGSMTTHSSGVATCTRQSLAWYVRSRKNSVSMAMAAWQRARLQNADKSSYVEMYICLPSWSKPALDTGRITSSCNYTRTSENRELTMRCLIIHNPASGPRSDEIFDLARALSQAGDEVTMRFIGDGMEPEDAAADVREFDRVVVSGGDGTVSNVLDHIRDSHVPTLVFPSGTANLFFNNIGNAPEPAAVMMPVIALTAVFNAILVGALYLPIKKALGLND